MHCIGEDTYSGSALDDVPAGVLAGLESEQLAGAFVLAKFLLVRQFFLLLGQQACNKTECERRDQW